jgi:hypothetical protein
MIDVLTAREQTIKAPNDWPLANRGNEGKILKTIISKKLQDLQLTYKALLCGGLAVVKR